MKTTLNIDDGLLRRARQLAASRGTTLTRVVEDTLRAAVDHTGFDARPTFEFPVVEGRTPPSIDPADRVALYELLDRDR